MCGLVFFLQYFPRTKDWIPAQRTVGMTAINQMINVEYLPRDKPEEPNLFQLLLR